MPQVFVKPYIPVQENQPELPYYLPANLDYSLPTEYASLTPPNQVFAQEQPNIALPAEQDYWTRQEKAGMQTVLGALPTPVKKLLGVGGEERYQTWPERTIRSALTLPVEAYRGEVQTGPGLRREDVTDIPGQAQPLDQLMERAQDVAGLAGGTMFAGVKPGVATLGAGPVKLYRGESVYNKGGKFWTTDPEFAKQFTKSGLESEVKTRTIKPEEIYKADHVYAGDPNAVDKVLLEAKKGGFKAVELNEGQGQPNSILFLSDTQKVGAPLAALEKAPTFYSNVENAVKTSKQNVADKNQWLSYLKNQPGVKPEELEWTVGNLPEGKITKQQLEQHIVENKVQLGEVWKGKNIKGEILTPDSPSFNPDRISRNSETKYQSYQLPGGENYRELLLTLPSKTNENRINEISKILNNKSYKNQEERIDLVNERLRLQSEGISNQKLNFRSSHWDEPNVLAHVRMNDRDIPNVGKSLHIEEIQSDWHQAGRKEGYKVSVSEKEKQNMIEEIQKLEKLVISKKATDQDIIRYNELTDYYNKNVNDQGGIPNAPFKKTWDELTIKRMIKEAVDNGYDAISWTPGEAQAARYDLSKQVDYVHYIPKTGELWAGKGTNRVLNEENVKPNELEKYIGKEAADKIINNPTETYKSRTQERVYPGTAKGELNDIHVLSGEGLKVGGEGMKAFYDKMMVDKVNQLAKKFGGKVETKDINTASTPKSLAYFLDWAKEHGDTRSRSTLGEAWSKGPADPMVKKFMEEQEKKEPVHVLKLTPELKKVATEKGFPLFTGGLEFPKPLEQPTFDERWRERVPEGEMPVPAVRPYPTNLQAPGRHMEKRPVRLTRMPDGFDPFK